SNAAPAAHPRRSSFSIQVDGAGSAGSASGPGAGTGMRPDLPGIRVSGGAAPRNRSSRVLVSAQGTQNPPTQFGVAPEQISPQNPQFAGVPSGVSQPFDPGEFRSKSQSPNPVTQVCVQLPPNV